MRLIGRLNADGFRCGEFPSVLAEISVDVFTEHIVIGPADDGWGGDRRLVSSAMCRLLFVSIGNVRTTVGNTGECLCTVSYIV